MLNLVKSSEQLFNRRPPHFAPGGYPQVYMANPESSLRLVGTLELKY